MKIKLECPHASYKNSRIMCSKINNGPCGHQYYKNCKGWWALLPSAARCLLREENRNA